MLVTVRSDSLFWRFTAACFPAAKEGISFYLIPSLDKVTGRRTRQGHYSGHEPVVLYAEPRYRSDGNLRQLYEIRSIRLPARRCASVLLDTFVAIMAGLIIFPACFSFGVQPDAGPSLIFDDTAECICKYGQADGSGERCSSCL